MYSSASATIRLRWMNHSLTGSSRRRDQVRRGGQRRTGLFAADHQHLHAALHPGKRRAQDASEGVAVAVDRAHRRHRQTGHQHAVEAGGDDAVARLHVGASEQEAHLEPALAGAEQHAAHPAAFDQHRDRLVAVRQQRHLGLHRIDPGDLADDAVGVDHRQSRLHPLARAAVEDDLAGEGIGRVVEDLGGDALHPQPLRHAEQLAQAGVLPLEQLEAQQAFARLELLAAQPGVVELDFEQGGEIARGVAHEVGRRGCHQLQRVDHHAEPLAHHLEVAEAQVEHQHRQAQRDEHQQAYQRSRSAPKDRWRIVACKGHREDSAGRGRARLSRR
jgi:hypothetical protein